MTAEFWDERYSHPNRVFGYRPNDSLAAQARFLKPASRVLCIGDGEGRNGVFLASKGHDVVSLDFSRVGLAMGILFGVIASGLGYALSGGKRDFNSARQTVAATYEVLAEHKVAQEARDLLASRPGARAAMFE